MSDRVCKVKVVECVDEEKSRKATRRKVEREKECRGRVDLTLKGQLLHFNGFALEDGARVVYQLTDELSLAGSFSC